MSFEDHREIEDLMYRYAHAVDNANWDVLEDLFAEAEVRASTSNDVSKGAESAALWRSVNKVHSDGTLRTRHLITNIIIDIDDDGSSARAQSYFMVFQQTENISLQPIAGGQYNDTFVRHDGAWHFTSKFIDVAQVGNTTDHLNVSLEGGPISFETTKS